jgi:hypothetical protein
MATLKLRSSQGLAGVGLQIQANQYGTFDAEIEGSDGSSTPLGTFDVTYGDSNNDDHSRAIFQPAVA